MTLEIGSRLQLVVDPAGGCSLFTGDGHEVVSARAGGSGEGLVRGVLGEGRDEWIFRVRGRRRLQILGAPEGSDRALVAYTGSSTAGVVLLGEPAIAYRLRNPLFGRPRFEDEEGRRLLQMRLRLFPRLRTSVEVLAFPGQRGEVLPLLGILASLTVVTITRPGLHWTTILAGAPEAAVARLRERMARELPAGGDRRKGRIEP